MNFIDNKYTRWYLSIIKTSDSHGEIHHVIPRSLGGSEEKENLVLLSPRKHFICHRLLTKMTQGDDRTKMVFGFRMMCMSSKNHERGFKITSHVFEQLKKLRKEVGVTQETREKMSKSMLGKNLGKTMSPAARAKMSESARNRVVDDSTREKISNRLKEEWAMGLRTIDPKFKQTGKSMLGKKHSEETLQRMRESAKNRPKMKWVKKNDVCKQVKAISIQEWLDSGWTVGRINSRRTFGLDDGYHEQPSERC